MNTSHLRDGNAENEVDILIELANGRVIGIGVKADTAPDQSSGVHLRWLRDAIGGRFLLGLVLHTGLRAFRFDHSILDLPICALWT
jgi:uncharacterized protein